MTTLDPHTQHRKLAALANFLDDLPSNRFYMPKWASPDATEHSCGTAGCMAGWAATKFSSEGWRIVPPPAYGGMGGVFYGKSIGHEAFREFFCLTNLWALNLVTIGHFYPETFGVDSRHRNLTPRIAAEAIRMCLREVDPAALEPEPVRELVGADNQQKGHEA